MEQVSGCLRGQIIPVSERSLLCSCSAAAKVSLWAEEKNKKTNCIPLENETNCAHFATGGVSECRHREGVLPNSVRVQPGGALCEASIRLCHLRDVQQLLVKSFFSF